MPIAVSEEHEALRQSAQRWLQNHCPPAEPRAAAESTSDELPPVWEKMVAQGWLGLHVPEADGGQGFDLSELAVVLEELGYALFPGPVLPTVLVAAVIARHGSEAQRARYLPGLLDGSAPAAVSLGAATLRRTPAPAPVAQGRRGSRSWSGNGGQRHIAARARIANGGGPVGTSGRRWLVPAQS